MAERIEIDAAVYKVATLVDNGIRVTLDLPETAVFQAAQLMECQRGGVVLHIVAVPRIEERERANPTRRRAAKQRVQPSG